MVVCSVEASLDCDRLAGCIVQLCQIGPQTAGMRERRRAATKSCKVRFSARLPCPAPSLSAPSQPTQSHQLQAGTWRGQFWKSTNNESNNNMLCWFFLTPDSACPLLRLLSVLPVQMYFSKVVPILSFDIKSGPPPSPYYVSFHGHQ